VDEKQKKTTNKINKKCITLHLCRGFCLFSCDHFFKVFTGWRQSVF